MFREPRLLDADSLWHFIDGEGDQQPPVAASQLREWLAQGYVSEATFVWADDASLADWTPLWQAAALYSYCTATDDAPAADADAPAGAAVGAPAGAAAVSVERQKSVPGQPPVFFIHDSEVAAEAKYERKRKLARGFSSATAVCLAGAAGAATVRGADVLDAAPGDSCTVADTPLLRVVFAWLCVFSLLLLAAELNLRFVRTYAHFLAYRTGRSGLGLFCATLLLASAFCVDGGRPGLQVGGVQWKVVAVAGIVLASSGFNLLVTKRGWKIGRSRPKATPKALL